MVVYPLPLWQDSVVDRALATLAWDGRKGADLAPRLDLHDDPAPGLTGGVGDHHEGKHGVVQVSEPLYDALIPLTNAEFGDVFGDGQAVVLLV